MAALRTMRFNPFLVVLLALIALNLAVGGVAYRYLGRIDADYTRLLNEGIPFLNNMQSVTALASRSYALMVDREQARTPDQAAQIEAEMDRLRKETDQIFTSPLNDVAIPPELKPAFAEIRKFREDGRALRARYLALLHDGKTAEAADFLRDNIYESHRAYLGKLDVFCDAYQEQFAQLNRKLNESNNESRNFLFGLSAVPLAIIAGGIVLAATLFLVLLAYRPTILITPKGRE